MLQYLGDEMNSIRDDTGFVTDSLAAQAQAAQYASTDIAEESACCQGDLTQKHIL